MCVDRGTVSKGAAYSVKLRLPDDHDIKFSFEIGSFADWENVSVWNEENLCSSLTRTESSSNARVGLAANGDLAKKKNKYKQCGDLNSNKMWHTRINKERRDGRSYWLGPSLLIKKVKNWCNSLAKNLLKYTFVNRVKYILFAFE